MASSYIRNVYRAAMAKKASLDKKAEPYTTGYGYGGLIGNAARRIKTGVGNAGNAIADTASRWVTDADAAMYGFKQGLSQGYAGNGPGAMTPQEAAARKAAQATAKAPTQRPTVPNNRWLPNNIDPSMYQRTLTSALVRPLSGAMYARYRASSPQRALPDAQTLPGAAYSKYRSLAPSFRRVMEGFTKAQ